MTVAVQIGILMSAEVSWRFLHFSEDHNTVVKLPVLLKYKLGNRLMSNEEIDVRIFTLCFLIG